MAEYHTFCLRLAAGRGGDKVEKEVDDAALTGIVPAPDILMEACIVGRSGAQKPHAVAGRQSAA